jgi:hypothetical protein
MRPSRNRTYLLQIRRNQRWVSPGVEMTLPYREAVRHLVEFGLDHGAQAIRLTVDGRVAAEAERADPTACLNGDWKWIRGGWNWSE